MKLKGIELKRELIGLNFMIGVLKFMMKTKVMKFILKIVTDIGLKVSMIKRQFNLL